MGQGEGRGGEGGRCTLLALLQGQTAPNQQGWDAKHGCSAVGLCYTYWPTSLSMFGAKFAPKFRSKKLEGELFLELMLEFVKGGGEGRCCWLGTDDGFPYSRRAPSLVLCSMRAGGDPDGEEREK